MSLVTKSITVTDSEQEFIHAQIATGNYGTDSKVIREALCEKRLRAAEIGKLREFASTDHTNITSGVLMLVHARALFNPELTKIRLT